MEPAEAADPRSRGLFPRAGIAALNLLAPGLGLVRLDRLRQACLFQAMPSTVTIAVLVLWQATPPLAFAPLAASWLAMIGAWIAAILASAWLSWRDSTGPIPSPRPFASRWYGLLAFWLVATVWLQLLLGAVHGYYKPYYMPADSMAPTLLRNDRVIASMRMPAQLRRGDLVIVRVGADVYVKRIAALPGDTIGMQDGQVVLNGRLVPQRLVRAESYVSYAGPVQVRRFAEQFPGETAPHEIYDEQLTAFDNVPEQRLPPGRIFVLGDNRDLSADSRVPRSQGGVELAPVTDVVGEVLYFSYGSSRPLGTTLGER